MIVVGNDNIIPKRLWLGEKFKRIIMQPLAGNSIRFAPTQIEIQNIVTLQAAQFGDGIQLNPGVLNSEIFKDWWRRELWIIGVNNAPWQCIVVVPGLEFVETFVE